MRTLTALLLLAFTAPLLAQTTVPSQEPISPRFTVTVAQQTVPVYCARVCALSIEEREKLRSVAADNTDTAFASFDLAAKTEIQITAPEAIHSVKVLPTSAGLSPTVTGNTIKLALYHPGQYVVEINGDWLHALTLFANPPEANVPHEGDPNLIYFGPGVHAIDTLHVTSNQTVYLAPGAFLYSKPTAKGGSIRLAGDHITLRGRGVIDGSLVPRGGGNILAIRGNDIHVEGVILRDSCGWTCRLDHSQNVDIRNLKVFGWRGNSDGIDICNSQHVAVSDCFLRTLDDLVVIKSPDNDATVTENITVKHCVLWNEFAHALSLGAELRAPVQHVSFSDCDVIHDKGREWNLRVYQCDSAPIHDVTFDNIRIEECRQFISLWIGKAVWSRDAARGTIDGVTFRNITTVPPTRTPTAPAELKGFDAQHGIAGALFENVKIGDRPLAKSDVYSNKFVTGTTVKP